jgi:c-di-GMP-binding flagellar brake protein YcgR
MTPQEIKLGTRLEFEMLNKQDEKVGNTFISQLLEHQDDGSIVISAPITESRVVFVPAGITVRLTFVHQLHGLIGLKALVKSKEYRGNVAVLIAEPEGNLEKIQRREHFRLDVVIDALIWPDTADPGSEAPGNTEAESAGSQASGTDAKNDAASAPVPDSTEEAAPVKAYTKNLSGSGVCVISDTNFPKGSNVRIELDLSNDVRFRARCVVLRSQPIEVRKGKSYELGIHFIEIKNRDQDNLIKFIFEQQRLHLKKEK